MTSPLNHRGRAPVLRSGVIAMIQWMSPRIARLWPAILAWALNAPAATLTIGVIERGADARLAPARVELAYPGQPGGAIHAAVEMAVDESRFELDAAKLRVRVDVRSARSPDDAKAILKQLSKAGAAG